MCVATCTFSSALATSAAARDHNNVVVGAEAPNAPLVIVLFLNTVHTGCMHVKVRIRSALRRISLLYFEISTAHSSMPLQAVEGAGLWMQYNSSFLQLLNLRHVLHGAELQHTRGRGASGSHSASAEAPKKSVFATLQAHRRQRRVDCARGLACAASPPHLRACSCP